MKTTAPLLVLLLIVSPVLASDVPRRPDVVTTAVQDGRFTTLATALEAAGLVDTLQGEGPFTVFAPTDAAFAALPEGTVAGLLEPAQRSTLRRILTSHVVSGRVMAADLLGATGAETLSGATFPLGLRIGDANVVQADIRCANGVIHVIDRVLLPPAPAETAGGTPHAHDAHRSDAATAWVIAVLEQAIERGAPIYNDGDHDGCARIYTEAASLLLQGSLPAMDRHDLERAMAAPAHTSGERAWNL
ncbi:MAG: fasciclin domain-containing protein, partial [Planctomycetota bacterium]